MNIETNAKTDKKQPHTNKNKPIFAWKKGLIGLGLLLSTWMLLGYIGAEILVYPNCKDVGEAKEIAGVVVEEVSFTAEDGVRLSGWLYPNTTERAIIFAGGIKGNRRQGDSRAAFFHQRGFSVLLMDLRGTGESDAANVTVGWDERKDMLAALRFLKERGYTQVGADGISLGAATIAYSLQHDPDFAFIILESSYDTLESAWRNRLAMFHIPHFISYPLRWFAEWKLGASPEEMQPVDYMQYCTMPALILGGDNEIFLKVEETQALYEQCTCPVKRISIFKGAGHINFLRYDEAQYTAAVDEFLAAVFGPTPTGQTGLQAKSTAY